jgi:hypothetical protein
MELCLWIPIALPSLALPMMSDVFKMNENAKAVQIDVRDPAKSVQIRASLDPK